MKWLIIMDQLDGVVLILSERWQENGHLNIQSRFCNGGQKSRPDAMYCKNYYQEKKKGYYGEILCALNMAKKITQICGSK